MTSSTQAMATSERLKMKSDEQGDKLNMTATAVHCQGCLAGDECYNNQKCQPLYGAYPSQLYGHQPHAAMPYSYAGQPSIPHIIHYVPLPANQPYYDFGPPPPQSQFIGYQHPPHYQGYHYAQYPPMDPNESQHYGVSTLKAPFSHATRYQGPPRRRSKSHCSSNYQNSSAAYRSDESRFGSFDMGSENSSLTLTGNPSEDVRRAMSFVKRNPNATLFSIEGVISEAATADDGIRRFIQERIKLGSHPEKRLGLKAALSSLEMLCKDEKGSGILQDIFTYGTSEMKKELLAALYDQGILDLSMNIHGCRVIQKAIRSINQDDLTKLIAEFHDHVLALIHDSHGNHVIQRCIQSLSFFAKTAENEGNHDCASNLMDHMQFIIDDIVANIHSLSCHRYGCRVVQRSIEFCMEKQRSAVLEAITASNEHMVEDLYGNYVVQQAIVTGGDMHRDAILQTLTKEDGSLFRLSKQKYASNVVEKMLQHGSIEQRDRILKELLKIDAKSGVCAATVMAQDPIANYVIKKAIESAPEGEKKQKLLQELRRNRDELVGFLTGRTEICMVRL
ncbi:hypothetical protein HJC23_007741 [Cyclotella cryptica]|uniref:PUM-HD domain-containing protein n=1 Tax=Cyclotella cryptica TaxID=29204 RepID=A0ABD3QZH1_9STRA